MNAHKYIYQLQANDDFWEECRQYLKASFFDSFFPGSFLMYLDIGRYFCFYYPNFSLEDYKFYTNKLTKSKITDFIDFYQHATQKYLSVSPHLDSKECLISFSELVLIDVILLFSEMFEQHHPNLLQDDIAENDLIYSAQYETLQYAAHDDSYLDSTDYISEIACYLYYHHHQGEDITEVYFSTYQTLDIIMEKINQLFHNPKLFYTIQDIDYMNGIDFENLVSYILTLMNYQCEVTPPSNDQGVDIIAKKDDVSLAVQAKRYNSTSVGNKAVQEVIAGAIYYQCNKKAVFTNSYFTNSAKELALSANVDLYDRDVLIDLLSKYLIPKVKPNFSLHDLQMAVEANISNNHNKQF